MYTLVGKHRKFDRSAFPFHVRGSGALTLNTTCPRCLAPSGRTTRASECAALIRYPALNHIVNAQKYMPETTTRTDETEVPSSFTFTFSAQDRQRSCAATRDRPIRWRSPAPTRLLGAAPPGRGLQVRAPPPVSVPAWPPHSTCGRRRTLPISRTSRDHSPPAAAWLVGTRVAPPSDCSPRPQFASNMS